MVAPKHCLAGQSISSISRLSAARNAEVRGREYLTQAEIERLIETAAKNRSPFTTAGWRKMLACLGSPPVRPHMLRHACGFKLANDGVDTDRYKTVRYTELAPPRFRDFWRD